jgi:hypothetical protein
MAFQFRSQKAMSVADVLRILDRHENDQSSIKDSDGLRRLYRQAAAVLVALKNPENLRPVGRPGKKDEGLELLRNELIPANSRRFEGRVMLRPEERRQALSELSTLELRKRALDANPEERTGALQQELEFYLIGQSKRNSQDSLTAFENTLQVATWLDGVVEGVPPIPELSRQVAQRALMEPFEQIAGDAIFRGRKSELDELRSYIGVLPPSQLLLRIRERAFRWLKPTAMPALSVSGPGGVGKSALIARFLLEHTRLPAEARIPFAYLDFDRPTLNIAEPVTLVSEMLDQLDLQFPEIDQFAKLRQRILGAPKEIWDDEDPRYGQTDDPTRSIMTDMLGIMDAHLGPRPFVVVLDTFEEVQYRGEQRAFPVWGLLNDLQKARPFLRVVVSGRAPVSTLELAGESPAQLELGDLDTEAAVAFLHSRGVKDRSLADSVVKQVGGVPLSLKLAATVLREEEGINGKGISKFSGRSKFWSSPSDEVIQGHLYERILGRLHDPRLERLAHPGLVLRRVNPDVIFNVLNVPCQLSLETLSEAESLFDELRREVSLVTSDSLDGSLIHRPDLRRTMLKLLVQKAPGQVEDIQRRAVEWYAGQQGWRPRAEEIYHRLQLGQQFISRSDVEHPEIRSSLQASMVEFPPSVQIRLAALGFQVAKDILQQATQEQVEQNQAAEIENLLPYGHQSLDRARRQLESLNYRGRSSWLYRSSARISAQLGKVVEALGRIDEGLHWAVLEGNTLQILELASDKAWLLRASGEESELEQALDLLDEYGNRHNQATAIIQHRAQLHEVSRSKVDREFMLREIARLLPTLSPNQLWYVWPALENVLRPTSMIRPEVESSLRSLVIGDSSPFQLANFADAKVQRSLERFVLQVRGPSDIASDAPIFTREAPFNAAKKLWRVWPYRILSVEVPYGSQGFDASYSAAAR